MKKIFLIPIFSLMLFSCSNQGTETISTQVSPSESLIETTIAPEDMSPSEIIEIPKTGELSSLIKSALSDSGIDDIRVISVDRSISSDSDRIIVDNNGTISLDVEIKTKSHNLIAHCMYIELIDSWSINSINDSETQNCYYSYDDGRFTNIYDYKTDKLLTESREDISNHDPIAEFNEQSESIDAEFDAGLKSLADKYGLEYLE